MMRATPYCSVRPIAKRAYMPPCLTPARRTSTTSIDSCYDENSFAGASVFPGGLGNDGLACALLVSRSHRPELSFLPLPHDPEVLVELRVELHRADDGVEAAL